MSRLKSPQAAAKQAGCDAKDAEQRRREKRNSWLMIIGLALVSISLVGADYFWLKARAQTNSPAAPVSTPEPQRAGALTNHE